MEVSDVLRSANERIAEINRSFDLDRSADARDEYLCECADLHCRERLELTPAEYRAVRADPLRFVVTPGCVDENVDRVIARSAAAVVVERTALPQLETPRSLEVSR